MIALEEHLLSTPGTILSIVILVCHILNLICVSEIGVYAGVQNICFILAPHFIPRVSSLVLMPYALDINVPLHV